MLRAMRITVTLLALLFAASAHASPPSANDDMDKLLADKRLLARMAQ